MKVWLSLILFYFVGYSGIGAYAAMENVVKYEKALVGEYFLLPPTEKERQDWEIKDRNFEIMQKLQEIDQLKRGKSTDDVDFILKQTDELLDHMKTCPPGHNPPQKEIIAMISDARTERNYYILSAIGCMGLCVYIIRRSPK